MVDTYRSIVMFGFGAKMTCKTQARFNRHILAVKRLTVISVENCVFLHLRSRIWHLSLTQMPDARVQMLKDTVFRLFLRVCARAFLL